MKILGIVCSPRAGGNTEILVREALEYAKEEGEVELLTLSGKEIMPCIHCELCYDNGECYIKDDMVEIYQSLLEAEGIIVGSPVYFWSISAQAKLIIDRTYALRYPTQRLKGKVGGAIAVAGRRGQLEALTIINNFFLGQGMISAGLGVDGRGSKKGEIRDDFRAINNTKKMVKRMIEIIKILKK